MKCQPIEKGWSVTFINGIWELRRVTLEQNLLRGTYSTKPQAEAAAREFAADVRRKAKERRA